MSLCGLILFRKRLFESVIADDFLEIFLARVVTNDNIFLAVNDFDAGSGISEFQTVLLHFLPAIDATRVCRIHKLPPSRRQHTVREAELLETPFRSFPNKPKQLAIFPLTNRYIT